MEFVVKKGIKLENEGRPLENGFIESKQASPQEIMEKFEYEQELICRLSEILKDYPEYQEKLFFETSNVYKLEKKTQEYKNELEQKQNEETKKILEKLDDLIRICKALEILNSYPEYQKLLFSESTNTHELGKKAKNYKNKLEQQEQNKETEEILEKLDNLLTLLKIVNSLEGEKDE